MQTPPRSILAAALFVEVDLSSAYAQSLVTIETVQVGDAGNEAFFRPL